MICFHSCSVHELEELIQRIHDGVVESMYKYFDEIQQEIIIVSIRNYTTCYVGYWNIAIPVHDT